MSLSLKIVSPEKVVFDGSVDMVRVPGTGGQFEILPDHAPIISSLEAGEVDYRPEGAAPAHIGITGGFVSVQKNNVSLCVEL